MRTLWRNARLTTLAGPAGWGLIERGALLADGPLLQWAGDDAALPSGLTVDAEHDLAGALVTPGLVDCHTHLVYAGLRAREFELRLEGASYEDIARAGGGIRSTVAATRSADDDTLFGLARHRALALQAEGVTTVEIKSGYGLSAEHEARCLRVARRLGREQPLTVRTTCLARALGLPVKLHAEQLSDQGGAELAASFGALSCDHLEYLSAAGVQAMARAGTVAVLLPGAYYFLREAQSPPIAALRAAGVPIALATDHNPGSSPTLSPLLMLNMACTLFRLTPEEALRGVTVNGARALGLQDRGRLAAGQRADFVVWPHAHPNELAYAFGQPAGARVVVAGQPVDV